MKLYLGPTSSLELIRYLRIVNGAEGLEAKPVRKRLLNDAVNTVKSLDELDAAAQFWLTHLSSPIHALVGDSAQNTRTKRLVTHVLAGQTPNGAFLDLGHNVRICTPQFAYLQLGMQLDFLDLLRIGLELCGGYSLDPEQPGSCAFGLPPAMEAGRMESFLERMAGQRGAVAARKTLRYLLPRSASPMESATYLLLCLPRRLGGYALPQPLLNPKVMISNPDGIKERYPDLFWKDANIDVEYNSDEDHSGNWARYRDSKREVELTVANLRVLPLTRNQLMDAGEFDAFAQGLRRMLGIRTRPHDPEWEFRRDELRRRLLGAPQ